jgi:hypothetical protein
VTPVRPLRVQGVAFSRTTVLFVFVMVRLYSAGRGASRRIFSRQAREAHSSWECRFSGTSRSRIGPYHAVFAHGVSARSPHLDHQEFARDSSWFIYTRLGRNVNLIRTDQRRLVPRCVTVQTTPYRTVASFCTLLCCLGNTLLSVRA